LQFFKVYLVKGILSSYYIGAVRRMQNHIFACPNIAVHHAPGKFTSPNSLQLTVLPRKSLTPSTILQ